MITRKRIIWIISSLFLLISVSLIVFIKTKERGPELPFEEVDAQFMAKVESGAPLTKRDKREHKKAAAREYKVIEAEQEASRKRRQEHEAQAAAFIKRHQEINKMFERLDKEDARINEKVAAVMKLHKESLADDEVFDAQMAQMDAEFASDYADIMDFIREEFITNPNGVLQRKNKSTETPNKQADINKVRAQTDIASEAETRPQQSNITAETPTFTWTQQMSTLNTEFYQKYPDVLIRPHLTDEEYQSFFPTEHTRQELQRRTETLQSEYATRLRSVIKQTPRQRHSDLFQSIRENLTQNWDSDFADAVIEQLQLDEK